MTGSWSELLDYYPAWLAYRRWYLRVPGVQFAVRHSDELVASGAVGLSDQTTGARLTERHLFRVASHSKTLAAVLVLQLVEQGAVRLDDAVGTHVRELAGSPVSDRTLGELLSHSGGVVRDSDDGDFWQSARPFPGRDELIAIAGSASSATLGRHEHYKYSNIGFGLLGLVIEAVTGDTYAQRVHDRIAVPLGLADLGGEYDPARAVEYASGHSSLAVARERTTIPHVDTRALAAATGSYATARDLTAFFSALLPGRTALLSEQSQRLQRHWQWDVKDGEQHYGLGLFGDTVAGTDLFGHTGGYPGHITASFADAEDEWVVSVLTNAIDGAASELASGLFRLRTLAREADHATCPDEAVRFTGRFASRWGVLDVARLEGRLFALHPTDPDPADAAAGLEVVDDQTLRIVGGRGDNSYAEPMKFSFDPSGAVESVRADSAMTMTPFTPPEAT